MVGRYAVIYEEGDTCWGAWVPDLAGCVAAGETFAEVEHQIRLAAEAFLECMRRDGEPVPLPTTIVGTITARIP